MSWVLPTSISDLLQNSCSGTFKPLPQPPHPSTSSCLLLVGKRLSILLPCSAFSTILHPHSLLKMAPTLEILSFSTPIFHLYQIPQHSSCNSRSQLNLLSSCLLCCSSSFSSFFFCPPIKQVGQFKHQHTPWRLKSKQHPKMQHLKEQINRAKPTEKVNVD